MRLEDLQYFQAIAEDLNIGRAALRLGLSQPALSKGLARLEAELGFRLFERTPKGVVLTRAADLFQERIRQVHDNLAAAIKEAEAVHLGALGTLRVGVSPLYLDHPFLEAAARLRRQRPAARLAVSLGLNDVLAGRLASGEIDVALSAIDASHQDGLRRQALFADDLRVVVRPGHPLLAQPALALADLVGQEWILPAPTVTARRQVEAAFLEAGLPLPLVAVEVGTSTSQFVGLVRRSDLLALLSDAVKATGVGADLVPLPVPQAVWRRPVGVMTRESGRLPPLALRFIELLQEVVAGQGAAVPADGTADAVVSAARTPGAAPRSPPRPRPPGR